MPARSYHENENNAQQRFSHIRVNDSGHAHAGNVITNNFYYATESLQRIVRDHLPNTNGAPSRASHSSAPRQSARNLLCGIQRRKFYTWSMVTIVVVALGLILGLYFGLKNKPDASSPTTGSTTTTSGLPSTSNLPNPTSVPGEDATNRVGGSLDASYYSTTGAWNGSGFSLTDQGYLFHVYFQHHSGVLTWMYNNDGWYGNASYIIATDARNSTAISALSYVLDGVEIVHVFCKSCILFTELCCCVC